MDSVDVAALFREKEHLEHFRNSDLLDDVSRKRFIDRINAIERELGSVVCAA